MELVARHTLPATEHPACGFAVTEPTDFTLTFGSTRNVVGVVSGENGELVEEAKEETETSVNGKGAQSRESGGSTDEESNAVSESGDHNREARNSESLTQLQASLILGFSWSETPTITNMSSTPTPEEGREEVRGFEFGGV